MSLLTANTILTAKIEGTYGTDPTPATNTDYVAAYNITMTPDIARNPSQATGASMSPRAGTRGAGHSGVSFDYEVQIVSTTDAFTAPMLALMKACGWGSSSGTYTPKTGDSLEVGTIDFTSGGTTEPVAGETITGATSGRAGEYVSCTLSGGTWGGGDAAGTMTLTGITGPLVFTAAEALNGSTAGADMATADGVGTSDLSAAYDSVTMWVYKDSIAWKPAGCRGDVKFSCNPGKPFLANFTMQGLYVEPADVAFPSSVTDTGTHTLVCMGGAFSIDSYTAVVRSLEFGLGCAVATRETIGAASPALQSVAGVGITGREPTVTIVVEAVKASVQDYFADFAATGDRATSEIELSYVMTDAGSNTKCTITMSKLEILNIVPGDDNGFMTYTITATPIRDLETGTLDYDSGGATEPTVGETITGATSGRVGTLVSYTTTGGAWATSDAEGVMTLSDLSGPVVYTNDELLTGSTTGADMATANGVGASDNIGDDEISMVLAAA